MNWTIVGSWYKQMEAEAPDGFKPVIEVELANGTKLQPGVVQDMGDGFIAAEVVNENGITEVIAFPESQIVEVRGRFVPSAAKAPTGFALGAVTGAQEP